MCQDIFYLQMEGQDKLQNYVNLINRIVLKVIGYLMKRVEKAWVEINNFTK